MPCYLACLEFNSPAGRLLERTDEDDRPLLLLQCNAMQWCDSICIDGFDRMDLSGYLYLMMMMMMMMMMIDDSTRAGGAWVQIEVTPCYQQIMAANPPSG
jgi:hypothetical protein